MDIKETIEKQTEAWKKSAAGKEMDDKIRDLEQGKKEGERILDILTGGDPVQLGGVLQDQLSVGMPDFTLYKIDEITYEDKAPSREAMENIFGSFRGIDGITLLYMILGEKEGASFYLGLAKDKLDNVSVGISVPDIGKKILEGSIKGNFRGCHLEKVIDKYEIWDRLKNAKFTGILEGVPSVETNTRGSFEQKDVQGADRLIDVMSGESFGYVILARPYTDEEMDIVEKQLYEVSDKLTPLVQYSMQVNRSSGEQKTSTSSYGQGKRNSESWSSSDSSGNSWREDYTKSVNDNRSISGQHMDTDTWNTQNSENTSATHDDSYTYVTGEKEHSDSREANSTSASASSSSSSGKQSNTTQSSSKGHSDTVTKASSESSSSSKSSSNHISNDATVNTSNGFNTSDNCQAMTAEQLPVTRRSARAWVEYIDKVLLPRLDNGRGKGLFHSCTYLFVNSSRADLYRLANTAISLFSGTRGNKAPLTFTECAKESKKSLPEDCISALKQFQIPCERFVKGPETFNAMKAPLTALSKLAVNDYLYRGSWLSSDELGLIAGFPQKEVSGLKLRKEVDFGLNVEPVTNTEDQLVLGNLVESGAEKKSNVYLNKKDLDKHTFIAGTTGSGKTTTCLNLLSSAQYPFLVIEPVKNEYRVLWSTDKDVIYFTPGSQKTAPFFLNPFEIFPGEEITARADMLKATFEASFRMEAAIPQLLEEGIYEAYRNKGWDINSCTWRGKSSENRDDPDGPFAPGANAFPTFSDYVTALRQVIDTRGFDERLRDEYWGTIYAMTGSLLTGAKGQMLNTPKSIDFSDLVNKKVVIELDEIKNGAEKSMLMGFILTNLMEAVKAKHEKDKDFHHITLVEEAHRLLSRYMPGDDPSKKQGVEVFADMLAEVRKYGESLIIVDQIPDKMTPEVLKNTNTKIVHKLFAQDDKEAIGNTMALNQDQKAFLSNLPTGRAIVFSQGWTKAVQVKVKQVKKTDGAEITDSEIHKAALKYYQSEDVLKSGLFPELCEKGKPEDVEPYLGLLRTNGMWMGPLRDFIVELSKGRRAGEDNQPRIERLKSDYWDELQPAIAADSLKFMDDKQLADFIFRNLIADQKGKDWKDDAEVIRDVLSDLVSALRKGDSEYIRDALSDTDVYGRMAATIKKL